MSEITYTQEQVDAMLQKEGDRRVTQALETAKSKFESQLSVEIEGARAKWQAEQTMTAEELAKTQLAEAEKALLARQRELDLKTNDLTAKALLAEAGIPKAQYEKMIGVLVSDNTETTQANITNFIGMFNETKTTLETNIRTELSKVPSPTTPVSTEINKESFAKMKYDEKLKFKAENPELFRQLMS